MILLKGVGLLLLSKIVFIVDFLKLLKIAKILKVALFFKLLFLSIDYFYGYVLDAYHEKKTHSGLPAIKFLPVETLTLENLVKSKDNYNSYREQKKAGFRESLVGFGSEPSLKYSDNSNYIKN